MNSQRLDEIRDTLRQQREKLWEGAIKADPELFKTLAERAGLSAPTHGQPENQAPDTLSAQRAELWENAIKADPELFIRAAEKAGLGTVIRRAGTQSASDSSPSYSVDDNHCSYAPR